MPSLFIKFLQSCFVVIYKRHYFLAVLGCFLLAHQNDVAIIYIFINHTISNYAESIKIAGVRQYIFGNGDKFILVNCLYWRTGGDSSQKRNFYHWLLRCNANGAGLIFCFSQITAFFEF